MSQVAADIYAWAPADTSVDERLGAFAQHLGLNLIEVAAGKVVALWMASEKHHQPHGIVHGGVHCSVVETLGSIGAGVWLGDKGRCVGVSNTTDFLRPVSDGPLVSTATPLHQGRTQQLWEVETRDRASRLVSRGQVRVQNIVEQTARTGT